MMLKNGKETILQQITASPWITHNTKFRFWFNYEWMDEEGLIQDADKLLVGNWFCEDLIDVINDHELNACITSYDYKIARDELTVYFHLKGVKPND